MSKKYIIIIALLALVAFTSGYLLIEKDTNNLAKRSGNILEKFRDPLAEPSANSASSLTPLTDHKVMSATNSSDKGVIFYEKNTGKVFKVDLNDRSEKLVSDKILANFIGALWAPNKKDVVAIYYSPKGNLFKYYNYDTKKTAEFDTTVKSVAFSPDGNLVAYFSFTSGSSESEGTGQIFISQPNGNYPKKILNTRLDSIGLYWPIPDQVALKTTSSLFLLTKDGAFTKLLDSSSQDLDVKWSQSGKKLLFSYTDSNTADIRLWLKDVGTKEETPLGSGFSAANCTWSIDDKNVVCSTPRSRGNTENEIYQINTSDASRELLATSTVGVKDLLLSSLEDYIVFTSPLDEKLYTIKKPSK